MKYAYYVVADIMLSDDEDDGIGDFERVCTEVILNESIKSMNQIDAIKLVFADEYDVDLEDVQISFYSFLRGIPTEDNKRMIDKFIRE